MLRNAQQSISFSGGLILKHPHKYPWNIPQDPEACVFCWKSFQCGFWGNWGLFQDSRGLLELFQIGTVQCLKGKYFPSHIWPLHLIRDYFFQREGLWFFDCWIGWWLFHWGVIELEDGQGLLEVLNWNSFLEPMRHLNTSSLSKNIPDKRAWIVPILAAVP